VKLEPGVTADVPIDDGNCFVCGRDNADGLRLSFALEGGGVVAELAVPRRFQGWRSVAHGGMAAALLDEAMAYAAGAQGFVAVTAAMRLRFRDAIPLETPLVVRGRIVWRRRHVLRTEASIADESGTVLAEGEGDFVIRARVEPGTFGNFRALPAAP
jgi:acyl-coenzyme A thioesterase PaaI-like protein